MVGHHEQDGVGNDRLGSLSETSREMQRPPVASKTPFLGEARPRQERSPRHVVGEEHSNSGQARIGLGVGNTDDDTRVDREVSDDVEEATKVGHQTVATRKRTVETIEQAIQQPQQQCNPPTSPGGSHTRPNPQSETDGGQLGRTNAGSFDSADNSIERHRQLRPNDRVKHLRRIPLGVLPALIILATLSLGALAGTISTSLRPDAILGGSYGFAAWDRLLTDSTFWSSVLFTLRTAVIATLLSALLAIPFAKLLSSADTPGHIRFLASVPIPIPHLVFASLMVSWLGPGGLLDRAGFSSGVVADDFGLGIILTYVVKETPFLTLLILATSGRDIARREEVARTLGLGRLDRWRAAYLPSITKPLLLGSLLIAAFVVNSTEVPAVIGPIDPDSISNWSITKVRVEGPVARAEAAASLVAGSLLALSLALAAFPIWRRITR